MKQDFTQQSKEQLNAELINGHYGETGYKTMTGEEEPDDRNKKLIDYRDIEGTPFTLVNEGKRWAIALGRFIVTPWQEEYQDEMQYLENHKWEIIINLMITMTEAIAKVKQEEQITHNNNQNQKQ